MSSYRSTYGLTVMEGELAERYSTAVSSGGSVSADARLSEHWLWLAAGIGNAAAAPTELRRTATPNARVGVAVRTSGVAIGVSRDVDGVLFV